MVSTPHQRYVVPGLPLACRSARVRWSQTEGRRACSEPTEQVRWRSMAPSLSAKASLPVANVYRIPLCIRRSTRLHSPPARVQACRVVDLDLRGRSIDGSTPAWLPALSHWSSRCRAPRQDPRVVAVVDVEGRNRAASSRRSSRVSSGTIGVAIDPPDVRNHAGLPRVHQQLCCHGCQRL